MTSGIEESRISLSPDWGQNNTRQRPYDPQRLGITFCPGRKGGHLASGCEARVSKGHGESPCCTP